MSGRRGATTAMTRSRPAVSVGAAASSGSAGGTSVVTPPAWRRPGEHVHALGEALVRRGASGARRAGEGVRAHPARVALAGLLALALGAGAVWALWFSPYLRVGGVDVSGVPAASRAAVSAALVDVKSTPLVEVDTAAAAERAGAAAPLRSVEVRRDWPATLAVTARPLDPVVALVAGSGAAARVDLVAADGVVFAGKVAPAGVPVVHLAGSTTAANGAARTAAIAAASALTAGQRAAVSRISVDERGWVTLRMGDVDVAWGDASAPALKAALLDRLGREAGVRSIDLTSPTTPAVRTAEPADPPSAAAARP